MKRVSADLKKRLGNTDDAGGSVLAQHRGRVKNVGGSLIFKQLYLEALSLIIGSANLGLEDFLLGKKPLFL
jgi:hypothetical protein